MGSKGRHILLRQGDHPDLPLEHMYMRNRSGLKQTYTEQNSQLPNNILESQILYKNSKFTNADWGPLNEGGSTWRPVSHSDTLVPHGAEGEQCYCTALTRLERVWFPSNIRYGAGTGLVPFQHPAGVGVL